jgi:hypothetical protein
VKENAIVGCRFGIWAQMEAHLEAWMRDVADLRLHSTMGGASDGPVFRDEAPALRQLNGTPPFTT